MWQMMRMKRIEKTRKVLRAQVPLSSLAQLNRVSWYQGVHTNACQCRQTHGELSRERGVPPMLAKKQRRGGQGQKRTTDAGMT